VRDLSMFLTDAIDTYRVNPEDKVTISDVKANDKSLFQEGGKDLSAPFLDELQTELSELVGKLYAQGKKSLLVVLQAMDTGGKDGTVRNVFAKVDPQSIHIEAFKRPTEEELSHDFLWRVHGKCPEDGNITVFNRSHYEDIIAVRVKKIFPDKVWKKRYRHIVEFERMLADEGTHIVKIFLRISKQEQAERLQDRLDDPLKHWKFEPNDLKDRAMWDDFMGAYEDLIEKTSTDHAPWYIVPADRKWYRNLVVTQIIIDKLKSMDLEFPEAEWDPKDMIVE